MKISSNQHFSNLAYYFLMFMVDYYKRVGKLKLSFDEMMVLNTVASHLAYSLVPSQTLSVNDVLSLKNEKIEKIHHKSKLSILSIANILDQPKESIRRRVNKLINEHLNNHNKLIRIPKNTFHLVKSLTNISIFHEIRLGPFKKNDSIDWKN